MQDAPWQNTHELQDDNWIVQGAKSLPQSVKETGRQLYNIAPQPIKNIVDVNRAKNQAQENLNQQVGISLQQQGYNPFEVQMGMIKPGVQINPDQRRLLVNNAVGAVGGMSGGLQSPSRPKAFIDAANIAQSSKNLQQRMAAIDAIKKEAERQLTPEELIKVKDFTKDNIIKKIHQRMLKEGVPEKLRVIPPSEEFNIPKSSAQAPLSDINPLIQEAKKYKSAEEFVRAQGKTLYHGSKSKYDHFDLSMADPGGLYGNSAYMTPDAKRALSYGENVTEYVVPKNAKLLKESDFEKRVNSIIPSVPYRDITVARKMAVDQFINEGYDGVKNKNTTAIFNQKALQTKSQLTDIYNRAHKGTK